MFRRLVGAAALLALTVPLAVAETASPARAADPRSVHMSVPSEARPGDRFTIPVTITTTAPIPPGTPLLLDVFLPARLSVESIDGHGVPCDDVGPDGAPDVQCVPASLSDSQTIDIAVVVDPGADTTDFLAARLDVDGQAFFDSESIHLVGVAFQFDFSGPARVTDGQHFTETVTVHSDHPDPDAGVSLLVTMPERLNVVSASLPGFTCRTDPFVPGPGGGGFEPSDGECDGVGIGGDGVVMTLGIDVEPGSTVQGSIDAAVTAGSVGASGFGDIVVVGSGPLTTVSGRVWNDLDRNGRQDPGEPGIPGIEVSGQFSSTTTGPDGTYTLGELELAHVDLRFLVLNHDAQVSPPNVGDDTQDSDVTIVDRDCADCTIGFVELDLTGPLAHVDAGLYTFPKLVRCGCRPVWPATRAGGAQVARR